LTQESLNKLYNLAIENGSQIALSKLAGSHMFNGGYNKAGPRLKQLWESGDTNSGAGLGFVYKNTDFDGPDPTKPNLVKSYAYQFCTEFS